MATASTGATSSGTGSSAAASSMSPADTPPARSSAATPLGAPRAAPASSANERAAQRDEAASRTRRVLNVIEPTRTRGEPQKEALDRARRYAQHQQRQQVREDDKIGSAAPTPPSPAADTTRRGKKPIVPAEVQAQFVRQQDNFYFPDGAFAFQVRNDRFVTRSENQVLIKNLILSAQANGWEQINVSGTERFRQRAWQEAIRVGLTVRGYEPSAAERAKAIRDIVKQSDLLRASSVGAARAVPEAPTPRAKRGGSRGPRSDKQRAAEGPPAAPTPSASAEGISRPRRAETGEMIVGRLIEHGPAPYRFEVNASTSYYAKLLTPDGMRYVWGTGLAEAITRSDSQVKVGDQVGLRRVGTQPVEVTVQERDAQGGIISTSKRTKQRTVWRAESPSWFVARAEAARVMRDAHLDARQTARDHPELADPLLALRAAQLLADERLVDKQDRERFIAAVASRLSDQVARGEKMPSPALRERSPNAADRTPRTRRNDLDHQPTR